MNARAYPPCQPCPGLRTPQGYLAHKKTPIPLGPPEDPRHRPTVESHTLVWQRSEARVCLTVDHTSSFMPREERHENKRPVKNPTPYTLRPTYTLHPTPSSAS